MLNAIKKILFGSLLLLCANHIEAQAPVNQQELEAQVQRDADEILDEQLAEMTAESKARQQKKSSKNDSKNNKDSVCNLAKKSKRNENDKK